MKTNDLTLEELNFGRITLTYQSGDRTIQVIQSGGADIYQLLERFREFCLAVGYQPETLKEVLDHESD